MYSTLNFNSIGAEKMVRNAPGPYYPSLPYISTFLGNREIKQLFERGQMQSHDDLK